MDIGKRLRELRKRAGFSVNKLSEWSGVSQLHLSKVDKSCANITVGHLNMVCDALGITLKEFFNVDEEQDEISAAISKLTPKQRQLLLAFLKSL